jgi:hypothetical protein
MELEKWIINHREMIGIVILILLLIFLCCYYYLNHTIQSEDKLESFRTGGKSTCGNNN